MSLEYYDWSGNHKIVCLNSGYTFLLGPNVTLEDWAEWVYENHGKYPSLMSANVVPPEFYERWKDMYALKGLLFEGEEVGGGL